MHPENNEITFGGLGSDNTVFEECCFLYLYEITSKSEKKLWKIPNVHAIRSMSGKNFKTA